MEGFEGLDDDLFDAHDAKPRQEASTSYTARICAPGWFSAPEYDHADLEIIKHRADTLYLSKQYQQCLDVVTRVLATRKESEKQRMWADMACRCHFALGQVEEALAEATALLHFDTTNDTTGRLLRARIEIALSKFPGWYSGSLVVDDKKKGQIALLHHHYLEAISDLQVCLTTNTHFGRHWVMLAECYLHIV